MVYNAKNGTITLSDGVMEYIRFGKGKRNLILLPGLGESLRSIRGTALPMAILYRKFAKDFTVYSFSRKYPLQNTCTTADLAADQIAAMDALGISKADLIGVSMGGMISQYLAADYPDRFDRLVLVVTCPEPNPIITRSINEWMNCALRNDHTALMESNLRLIYSDNYCKRNRWMIPIVGRLTKPVSYERFLIQARACLTHNAKEKMPLIRAKTLIIGGEKDLALGGEASREMARLIKDAELHMYPQWGHGLYDEEKGFQKMLLDFLLKDE